MEREDYAAFDAITQLRKVKRVTKNEEKIAASHLPFVLQSKNVYCITTDHGKVMYYPSSNKWQFKTKVRKGTFEEFELWLKNQGFA